MVPRADVVIIGGGVIGSSIGPEPALYGLYVAAGFSGHGFQLAPAVGQAVAAALHGERSPSLDALSPARVGSMDPRAVHAFQAGRD